jgi:heme oxygenase
MSALREITSDKHREAETTPFVQYMYSGNISSKDYVTYLEQIYHVYKNLEYFSVVSGLISGMVDIQRHQYIKEDIEELGGNINVEVLPSVQKYIKRVYELYHSNDRNLLMAHIYVRHMGDLFGGKMIAKKVPGSGNYYQFADRATLVKQLNEKITLDLAEEALLAFDMSKEIFNEVYNLMENKNEKNS